MTERNTGRFKAEFKGNQAYFQLHPETEACTQEQLMGRGLPNGTVEVTARLHGPTTVRVRDITVLPEIHRALQNLGQEVELKPEHGILLGRALGTLDEKLQE